MSVSREQIVFVDTEATSLNRKTGEIWEVAIGYWQQFEDSEITGGLGAWGWAVKTWHLPIDLGRADAESLKISGFYDRAPQRTNILAKEKFAQEFERATRGKHLIGNVISFDELRLYDLLRANGAAPSWHYHSIDIEPAIVGYNLARGMETELPWDSDMLSFSLGVDPGDFERHTASGDVRWAVTEWEALHGSTPVWLSDVERAWFEENRLGDHIQPAANVVPIRELEAAAA
jgi:hypothetical protein